MATHSSVLAWRIPGMAEPDGLPSLGSQSRTWLKWLSSSSSRVSQGLLWRPNRKQSACSAGVTDSIPRSGRSLGEEKGNSLKYSCLGNAMDRGLWWATVHGVARDADELAIKPPPGSYIENAFKYSVFNNYYLWNVCFLSMSTTKYLLLHSEHESFFTKNEHRLVPICSAPTQIGTYHV